MYSKKSYDDVTNPKYKFYVLYEDDRSYFEEFIDSLEQASDLDEFDQIRALMDKVDNNNLPKSKYRHIKGGKSDRKDVYEFKSKHLRIYAIKMTPNYYLLLGGHKKTQDKDIDKVFRHFNDVKSYDI
ncbi:MAG: hypothetical protein K2M97_04040 [Muribaculaceae bacterium]|nr:hypothetical protein [Muribaculaceae bacterium]